MVHLLVDNPVDASGPYTNMTLPGSGTVSNSQCTISALGSAVSANGTTLNLTLAVTFTPAFVGNPGNNIFYLAARSNTQNSGWQAVGTVAAPQSF